MDLRDYLETNQDIGYRETNEIHEGTIRRIVEDQRLIGIDPSYIPFANVTLLQDDTRMSHKGECDLFFYHPREKPIAVEVKVISQGRTSLSKSARNGGNRQLDRIRQYFADEFGVTPITMRVQADQEHQIAYTEVLPKEERIIFSLPTVRR